MFGCWLLPIIAIYANKKFPGPSDLECKSICGENSLGAYLQFHTYTIISLSFSPRSKKKRFIHLNRPEI